MRLVNCDWNGSLTLSPTSAPSAVLSRVPSVAPSITPNICRLERSDRILGYSVETNQTVYDARCTGPCDDNDGLQCQAVLNRTTLVRNSCPFDISAPGSPCMNDSCQWSGLSSVISQECCHAVADYCGGIGSNDLACFGVLNSIDSEEGTGIGGFENFTAVSQVCGTIPRVWRPVTIPVECDCVGQQTSSPTPQISVSPSVAPTLDVPCDASVRIISNTRGSMFVPTQGEGYWLKRCPGTEDCFELKQCNGNQQWPIPMPLVGNYFDGCMHRLNCDDLSDEETGGGQLCMSLVECDWSGPVTSSPTQEWQARTLSPTSTTVAPSAVPTEDQCCCQNHPNNSFTNPECCIHGISPERCNELRWGPVGDHCTWSGPSDTCGTIAPTSVRTAEPSVSPTIMPISSSPTPRPSVSPTAAPFIIIIGDSFVATSDPEVVFEFDYDYDQIDPVRFVNAVMRALIAEGVDNSKVKDITVKPGSVIVTIRFVSEGAAEAVSLQGKSLSINYDGDFITAAAVVNNVGSSEPEASDNSTTIIAIVAVVVVLILVVVIVVFIRSRRDKQKQATRSVPNIGNVEMDIVGPDRSEAAAIYHSPVYQEPDIQGKNDQALYAQPNEEQDERAVANPMYDSSLKPVDGFVLSPDKTAIRLASVRRSNPIAQANSLYVEEDIIGESTLNENIES